jgi:DNA helicase II / ATP-dependent DNA helicase PcrA
MYSPSRRAPLRRSAPAIVNLVHRLNEEQKRAVTAGDGPIIIVAGPGTGKTKTLTARISYLLDSGRAEPSDILALTFTKKAAEEMRERVGRQDVMICTFHALCRTLLGGAHEFISEPERLALIKSLTKPMAFKGLTSRDLGLRISRAKNLADQTDEPLARLVTIYNQALAERQVIDFDDLLGNTRDALESGALKRPAYRYILVDEFQDTNLLQYTLLQLLRTNDNLFIIGDPNQSIYGFRGASGTIFDTFKADFPQATAITLTANYRSALPIVTLANAVFGDNQALHAKALQPGEVQAFKTLNEYSEAHWVVNRIQQAIGGADMLQGGHADARSSLKDFAILYRSRRAAMQVQKYIADSGLPYQIVGDGSPYERQDIQTVITVLRQCAGQQSVVPGFSAGQVATLMQKIVATQPPDLLAVHIASVFGIKLSRELHQFIGTLVRFTDLSEVIRHLDTLQSQEFYDSGAEVITLLTIHASKGLEFPHVFLIAAEENILPSANGDEQEERRLFYVAVTRAKETLDITHATRRGSEKAMVSRFINEISDAVLPKNIDPTLSSDIRRLQKRQAKQSQTTLF